MSKDINGTCISSTTDEYGPIYVYETRTARILSFDGKIYQSSMKLKDVNGLTLDYTQAMMAGLLFVPTVKIATIMGLGAGSMVKKLLSSFYDLNVHAVECREAVVKAAKKYFYLPDTDRLIVHIDDAANHVKNIGMKDTYIKSSNMKSDIIFSDLYTSAGMEPKQVEQAYLRDCKNALNKQGVLVLNIWNTALKSQEEIDEILELEFKNRLLRFKVESGNTIVLSFKNDIPSIKREELLTKGKWLQEKMNIPMERYAELLTDVCC